MAFMQEFLNFGACFSTQILYNRFQKSQATGLWKRFQKPSGSFLRVASKLKIYDSIKEPRL